MTLDALAFEEFRGACVLGGGAYASALESVRAHGVCAIAAHADARRSRVIWAFLQMDGRRLRDCRWEFPEGRPWGAP